MKSHTQWIKEGDKNMKFFHAQTMKRRRCNKIVGLENERGYWCSEPVHVDAIVVGYFQKLFLTCDWRILEITDCVETRLLEEDRRQLMWLVLAEEVKQIVFQIPADKSLGPNGFTGNFYHEY